MKQKNIIITVLAVSILSGSCSKTFLDTPPTTSAEQSSFITSLSACEQLLSGAYRNASDGYYYNADPFYADIAADNMKLTGYDIYLAPTYSWSQVASREGSDDFNSNYVWSAGYMIIRTLGFVTDNVDKFRNENPSVADRVKAEALALRALIHFDLLNRFAQPYKFSNDASHPGIPYITTADKTIPVKRNTVGECYNFMIQDLMGAIQVLPNLAVNKFRFGKYAAMALLSRVYLYKGDYANAKNNAVAVAKVVPIMKTGYPANLFTAGDAEALLHLPPTTTINYSAFPALFLSDAGYGLYFEATDDIFTILKSSVTDKRNAWVTKTAGTNLITKFPVGAVAGVPAPNGSYYFPLLRSSESYLNAAESFYGLNMRDSAIYYLDEIKKRADAAAPSTTVSGQQLLDAIILEKRKEFAFEGHRLFDLMRVGQGVNRIDAPDPDAKTLPYKAPHAISPIPLLEVDQYGLKQNEGY